MVVGEVLARSAQLARLDSAARADMLAHASRFALDAGDVLFRQGDAADALYILETGRLAIETRLPGDDSAALSPILPGEVVGEFALLDDAPRSAMVSASEPSSGWRIGRARFHAALADAQPGTVQLAAELRRLVATRLRATLARIAAEGRYECTSLRGAASAPVEPVPVAGEASAMIAALAKLAELGTDGAQALSTGSHLVALTRGQRLAAAGEPPKALRIVLRGALRASLPRPEGSEQVFVHGPGECVGVVPLEDDGVQPLDLAAAEDCVLLSVPPEAIVPVLDPSVAGAADWQGSLALILGRQLVRDQRRANRHLGRALALERFNACAAAARRTLEGEG